MNENYMRSCSNWGMFPIGYMVHVSISGGAIGTAMHVRTDEAGNVLDDIRHFSPSAYNDISRQFMVRRD
jgi:hypothetical protein